jgi:DNA polymerase-3 subunit gamma/tau
LLSKDYRPKKFIDLVGQEENVVILKEILKKKAFGLPFLFTGPFGSGKTSASRVFAKAILCQNPSEAFEPCDTCESCIDFQNDKNVNYSEIDAASNGDVQSIRDLREMAGYSSVGASAFKITNIDEAHNITKQGYNALLKLLEEGSANHIFIFCTNEPEKMLDTVRSRCWRIHTQLVTADNLFGHLKRVREMEAAKGRDLAVADDALELLAGVTAPHIRDALNTLDFLSYKGSIEKRDVESYYQISDQNLFLELLISLKDDLPKAVATLEAIEEKFDADAIYKKVLDLTLALHAKRKGAEYKVGYADAGLLDKALAQSCDYLAVSSFLLSARRPLDTYYLKYLLLQTNRLLNNESMLDYLEVPTHAANNPSIKPAVRGSVENKTDSENPAQPIIQGGLQLSSEELADDGRPAKRQHPSLMKRDVTVKNYQAAAKVKLVPAKDESKYLTSEQLRDFLLSDENEKGYNKRQS